MAHTPTSEGIRRYPPRGYAVDGAACDCLAECPNPCLGVCGCEACGDSGSFAFLILFTWPIAGLNFIAFIVIATYLGGDAINGHAEAGRYFLSEHGRLTEVSYGVFLFSYWHCLSVWATHALAFGAFGWMLIRSRFRQKPRT